MYPPDKALSPAALRALADLDRAEWASFQLWWLLGYLLAPIAGIVLGPIVCLALAFMSDAPDDGAPMALPLAVIGGGVLGAFLGIVAIASLHVTATAVRAFRRRGWAASRLLLVVE
jgi:hypothetical protein